MLCNHDEHQSQTMRQFLPKSLMAYLHSQEKIHAELKIIQPLNEEKLNITPAQYLSIHFFFFRDRQGKSQRSTSQS